MNYKYLFAFIGFLAMAILMKIFETEYLNCLKVILESEFTKYIINGIVFIIYILFFHLSLKKDYNVKSIIISTQYPIFDIALAALAVNTGIYSCLTIIKGIFLQSFFDIIYFKEFESFELSIIFITIIGMLYYFIMQVAHVCKEVFWVDKSTVVIVRK